MALEVPEEATEKAARASFYLLKGPHEAAVKFEDLPQPAIDGWLASARKGLEAAAPLIVAAELGRLLDVAEKQHGSSLSTGQALLEAVHLRLLEFGRAFVLRGEGDRDG